LENEVLLVLQKYTWFTCYKTEAKKPSLEVTLATSATFSLRG